MHPVESPIVKASHPEGTSIADPLAEDLPRVTGSLPHFPRDLGHIAEMVRFLMSEAIGGQADPGTGEFHGA